MESQKSSLNFEGQYGSARASVTSKEVQNNPDPLDAPASTIHQSDRDSTNVHPHSSVTPDKSAVPGNHHHASPHFTPVPFPHNGPYSQYYMMPPNHATALGWPYYGHPSMMPCSPYPTSSMYRPSDIPTLLPHSPPQLGSHLSDQLPESDETSENRHTTSSAIPAMYDNTRPPILTSANNFQNWVKFYIKFLQNSDLGDILPTEDGEAAREMTYQEHMFIYNTFQMFAPYQLLPTWVQDILTTDSTDILKILSKSIAKSEDEYQDVHDLNAITNLKYDGSIPAERFENFVTNLIDRLNKNGHNITNKLGCALIRQGLSGKYESLRFGHRYNRNMTIAQLMLDIEDVYRVQQESRVSRHHAQKPYNDYKHTTRNYPAQNDARVVTRNSKTNHPKTRTARAHNISTTTSSRDHILDINPSYGTSPKARDASPETSYDHQIYLNNNPNLDLRQYSH